MGKVFVLPGCMGTELWAHAPGGTKFWVDSDQLASEGLERMGLNGKIPELALPGQFSMYPGTGIPDYYKSGMEFFAKHLDNGPWEAPILWGYDWRINLNTTADKLVADIEAQWKDSGPVILIGHSQGGLIARLAYLTLNSGGKADHVYRMICLGTPHKGTCKIPTGWSGLSQEGIMYALMRVSRNPYHAIGFSATEANRIVANVTLTWPGFYDLMPQVGNSAEMRDKNTADLYTSAFWGAQGYPSGLQWRQELADHARIVIQGLLKTPESIPVGRKLVNVVSTGYETWVVTADVVLKTSNTSHYRKTKDGDGTVTVDSAFIEGSQKVSMNCPHDRLFKTAAESGLLADLVNESFTGPAAPPVPDKVLKLPPIEDTIRQMPLRPTDFPSRRKLTGTRRH